MRDAVTTALDVLGLLAVSAGVYFATEPVIGPAALVGSGVVTLAGSAFFAWQGRR